MDIIDPHTAALRHSAPAHIYLVQTATPTLIDNQGNARSCQLKKIESHKRPLHSVDSSSSTELQPEKVARVCINPSKPTGKPIGDADKKSSADRHSALQKAKLKALCKSVRSLLAKHLPHESKTSSSDEPSTYAIMQTTTPVQAISKHVFVNLQNNNNEVEVAPNADNNADNNATEMYQASTHPAPKSIWLAIPPVAEATWNTAKQHQGVEQKPKMQADHIDHLLETDVIPAPYLGSKRLSRYFLQQDCLPTPMRDLILKQGREKALLASQLLRQQQVREKGYVDFYTRSTADIY